MNQTFENCTRLEYFVANASIPWVVATEDAQRRVGPAYEIADVFDSIARLSIQCARIVMEKIDNE
jgi:hypothetical protein